MYLLPDIFPQVLNDFFVLLRDGIHFLTDYLVSWCTNHWPWAIVNRNCDSSVWAIGFTMNTWAGSLDRARFQLHGLIRKTINDSRAEARQAHFLERLGNWKSQGYDRQKTKKFLKIYDIFLTQLERFERRYPTLQESEEKGLPISWFPHYVLVFFACFSLACLLFRWFCNVTLIVLLPYPCFCIYYKSQQFCIRRKIKGCAKKLIKMFPEMENGIKEEEQEIEHALSNLIKRSNRQNAMGTSAS